MKYSNIKTLLTAVLFVVFGLLTKKDIKFTLIPTVSSSFTYRKK